jgi:DNA polymerase-3 subunit beta
MPQRPTDLIAHLLDHEPKGAQNPAARTVLALTIQKFILQILLERAATVVPTRDVMPVLKNFQMEARPHQLRIIATDMELSMIAATEIVTVEQPGCVVIPARKLLDIVREADDGDVSIQVASTGLAHITIARTTWRLKLDSGEDYPALPEVTDAIMAPINRRDFATALGAVAYAACRDVNRPSLMMIDVRSGTMTACDGAARFQQATVGTFPFGFQLPVGAVDDLLKLLTKVDVQDIRIGESDHHLIFSLGTDLFIVNKLHASFPNLEATFLRPALTNRHPLTVDRGDLLQAIKRVRINADRNTAAIALRLAPGTITVASRDMYGNDATETVTAEWNGPERTLAVNHGFLTDLIGGHPGRTLEFRIGEDTKTRKSPILLRDPDAGTTGVVQQMLSDWLTTP